MRFALPVILAVLLSAGGFMASEAPASLSAVAGVQQTTPNKKPLKTPKDITLTGCIEPDPAQPGRFMMTDTGAGTRYHVFGKSFREYLGRPVELDGGIEVKGLKISGGLRPNANIAAQAGAIDPAQAAVQAATSESTTGTPIDVQEFRVKAIRPASGTCQ
jgi:hypothetical protein